jgi:hypothetical protein
MAMSETVLHEGGCHCGAVRFRVHAPSAIEVIDCNCSLCRMSAYEHWIVAADRFELLTDPVALTEYRFNTGIARHLFCARCGIKSFYVPRSHPDGYSVNLRCVDPGSYEIVRRTRFDGQNWEASIGGIT